MGKSFVLVGKEGAKIELSGPFLNEQKELEFMYCSHFVGKGLKQIVFNDDGDVCTLELRGTKNLVKISLHEENQAFVNQAKEVKKIIKTNLMIFVERMKRGEEEIRIYPTSSAEYPVFVTTKGTEEHAGTTGKYFTGLLYFVNSELEKNNLPSFSQAGYDEMQKAFGKMDLSQFKQSKDKNYYVATFKEFMHAFMQSSQLVAS